MGYADPSGHDLCQTQIDLYNKYRAEGMKANEAFNKMRDDLELPRKGDNGCASGDNAQNVTWNNGWRTPDGKFASPKGSQKAGAWAEQDVWDAIKQKDGWDVVEGRVYTKDAPRQVRIYDGIAVTPSGKYIGLEVRR